MLDDVLQGLSGQPKTLPSRLLYDARGSDLFEDITALPEYYPTRTERAILTEAAPALADAIGPGAVLVEYGAGASVKTRILLDAMVEPAGYVPIDVSDDMLAKTKPALERDYPGLPVHPVVGNFLVPPPLPDIDPRARRVGSRRCPCRCPPDCRPRYRSGPSRVGWRLTPISVPCVNSK